MDDDATGPAPWWVAAWETARPALERWWPTLVAVAAFALSPLIYVWWSEGRLSSAVLLSSLFVWVGLVAVAVQIRPITTYVTRRRRLDALGGRAFTGALAYIPTGYATLWLLHLFSSREFPLLEVSALRYVLIWPFYLWFVTFCSMDGMPCPAPPGT